MSFGDGIIYDEKKSNVEHQPDLFAGQNGKNQGELDNQEWAPTHQTYGGPANDPNMGRTVIDDDGRGAWGRVRGVVQGDGRGVVQVGKSGAEQDVDRYRGMGAESDARDAYQLQFGKAIGDENRAYDARGYQGDAGGLLRFGASGGAPSRAEIEGRQVASNSLEAQLAGAGGARGMNPAAAARSADAQQGQQLEGVERGLGDRSTEMGAARGSETRALSTIRGQDYAGQGLAQDRAEAQAKSELAQRHMNAQRKLAMEKRAFDVRKAQQGSFLTMQEIDAQNAGAAARAKETKTNVGEDIARGAGQAVINFSDKDAKNVKPKGALAKLTEQAKRMREANDAEGSARLSTGPSIGKKPMAPGALAKLTREADAMRAGVDAQRTHLAPGSPPTPDRNPKPIDRATFGGQDNGYDRSMYRSPEGEKTAALHRGIEESLKYGHSSGDITREDPYAPKSLFGDAPEGYAAQRAGRPGGMFNGEGFDPGSPSTPPEQLAPGTEDFAPSKPLSAEDERISLSDEDGKKKQPTAGTARSTIPRQETEHQAKEDRAAGEAGMSGDRAINKPVERPVQTSEAARATRPTAGPAKTRLAPEPNNITTAEREGTGDVMTGDRVLHNPTKVREAASSTTTGSQGYARQEGKRVTTTTDGKTVVKDTTPETPEQRTERMRKAGAALGPQKWSDVDTKNVDPKAPKKAGALTSMIQSKGGGEDRSLQQDANRKLAGETFTYKDGLGEDTEQLHHGFMAQNLQENPITATAVRDDDPSGLLKVDNTDALRVTAAGVAENQNQIDDLSDELEKLRARRSRRTG